jgi:mutator protein MutT
MKHLPTKVCTLIFLRKDGQILLAMKKRGFGSNRYNGIGGKIEPGETIEQALIRETEEEILVTPIHFWKVARHDFLQENGEKPWHMIVHVYFCDKWQGTPTETEEMAPEWFAESDIPYDNMWSDDEFWLPQVLAGEKNEGVFHFNDSDELLSYNVQTVENVRED